MNSTEIQIGKSYTNGAGVHRRVISINGKQVTYRRWGLNRARPYGSTGKILLSSFVRWARRVSGTGDSRDEGELPDRAYFATQLKNGDWIVAIAMSDGWVPVNPEMDLGGSFKDESAARCAATEANSKFLKISQKDANMRCLRWSSAALRR